MICLEEQKGADRAIPSLKQTDNYKTGYLHTLKDPKFQNDLQKKLQSISQNPNSIKIESRENKSIDSPVISCDTGSAKMSFKTFKNKFKFKGRKSHRNCHTSHMRSKNDSLNGSENGGLFKSKFENLKSIDDEESKYGQLNSLENQELLLCKLNNLEKADFNFGSLQEYHSGPQSMQHSDKKMGKKAQNQSSYFR